MYIKPLEKHTHGYLLMFSFCHTIRKVETYDAMIKMLFDFLQKMRTMPPGKTGFKVSYSLWSLQCQFVLIRGFFY